MSRRHLVAVSLLFCVLLPNASWSDPPAHAPAHGHRAKHGDHGRVLHSGVEVVFDSERGVHIAVGFPGLFFHEGQFYQRAEHGWQVSARHDGGWSAAISVPSHVVKAKGHRSAKHKKRK